MWANGKKARTDGARQNTRMVAAQRFFNPQAENCAYICTFRATTFKFRVRNNNNNINNKNNFIEKPQPFGKYLIK